VPGEVLTDNGKQFTDRFGKGGEVLFDRICRDNGITHRLTQLVLRRLEVIEDAPLARLFTGPRGGRITTAVLRDATHWDDVVTSRGYPWLHRHGLRLTGLTWMADAGVPPHGLQKIAGHGSLTTTQRYLHPDARSFIAAGEALSAHLGAS
jgi:integrase